MAAKVEEKPLDFMLAFRRLLRGGVVLPYVVDLDLDAADFDVTIDDAGVAHVTALGGGGGISSLTGDVTATGPGAAAATISAGAITNAKVNAAAAIAVTKLATGAADGEVLARAGGINTFAKIADANVATGAAIAGSKVTPAFGAQNVTFTGYLGIGATIPTAGEMRIPNVFQIRAMNSTNGAERKLFYWSADTLTIGDPAGGIGNLDLEANQLTAYFIGDAYIDCATVYMRGAAHGAAIFKATTTAIEIGVPIIGNASGPGSVDGMGTKAMAGATATLVAAEYVYKHFKVTGSGANTIKYPAAASDAAAYSRFVWNAGSGTLTVQDSNSVGAAASLAAGTGAWFLFSNGSVKQMCAAFTVA